MNYEPDFVWGRGQSFLQRIGTQHLHPIDQLCLPRFTSHLIPRATCKLDYHDYHLLYLLESTLAFLSKVCQLETLNIQDCPAPRNILLHRPPPMGPQVHPNPTAPPYTRLQTKELRSSVLHDCATTWGWAVPGSTSAKGEWQDDRDSRRYNLV